MQNSSKETKKQKNIDDYYLAICKKNRLEMKMIYFQWPSCFNGYFDDKTCIANASVALMTLTRQLISAANEQITYDGFQ